MTTPTIPQAPSNNPFTDPINDPDNPFKDSNEAKLDLNDLSVRTYRFCHFFVQTDIHNYQTSCHEARIGTYPREEGSGRHRGRVYHETQLRDLTGSAIDAPVVDITFDVCKHRLGLTFHALTVRVKFEVKDDRTQFRVLLCINVPNRAVAYHALRLELGEMFMHAVIQLIRERKGLLDFLGSEELRDALAEQFKKPTTNQRLTVKVRDLAVALDHNQLGSLVVAQPSWSNPTKLKFGKSSDGWPQKLF